MQAWYLGNMNRSSGYQSFTCASFSNACPQSSAGRRHSVIDYNQKWSGRATDLPIAWMVSELVKDEMYKALAPKNDLALEFGDPSVAIAIGLSGAGAIVTALEGAGAGVIAGATGVAGVAAVESGEVSELVEAPPLISRGTNPAMFQQAVEILKSISTAC